MLTNYLRKSDAIIADLKNQIALIIAVTSGLVDVDGNNYSVVKIGEQIWMKENLKVTKYRNGVDIPTGLDNSTWVNTTNGAYAIYNDDAGNEAINGKLYNWYTVDDEHGLCPLGWHVPSHSEWITLTTTLGGEDVAGGRMKATGTKYWNSPNGSATNESGFTALPGGVRSWYDGSFKAIKSIGVFWSSSASDSNRAWSLLLANNRGNMDRGVDTKRDGFSVRCLRD